MLYFPHQSSELESLENLQKTFTKKIPEVQHLDYWSRLKQLRMYSQQRRADRYKIIHTWKVLEKKVPNCGIQESTSLRRGRECTIPALKGSPAMQNLRDQSFQVTGPRLFNSLPRHIRDTSKATVDEFKEKLDKFLAVLPDEPKIGEMIPHICDKTSANPSNSLIDVILYQKAKYVGG